MGEGQISSVFLDILLLYSFYLKAEAQKMGLGTGFPGPGTIYISVLPSKTFTVIIKQDILGQRYSDTQNTDPERKREKIQQERRKNHTFDSSGTVQFKNF